MKTLALALAAAGLVAGSASFAQTTTTPHTAPSGAPAATAPASPSMTTGPVTAPANTTTASSESSNRDTAAASGDSNQAVATTSANAPTPAKGANSFTMGEARSRLEKNGFSNVTDLTKDDNGVWRGKAQKGGNTTTVWLDYKGNVGESTR
jgi:hypothetical protein